MTSIATATHSTDTAAARRVLVVGAAGRFAGLVPQALRDRGVTVRGLVRDAGRSAVALANGTDEVAVGDLRSPQALAAALDGVDGVFYIGPAFAPDESQLGVNMVRAARRAGVRRFVFSSVIQPTDVTLANHASKIPVEQALFDSGLQFTVLQPANFYQNLLGAWAGVLAGGVFAEPYPVDVPVARVDYRDVAEVAAMALTTDRLAYGCFELTGEPGLTRAQIAAMMGDALGRPVAAGEIDFERWAARLPLDYSAAQWDLLRKIHEHYASHGLRANTLVLRAILGRPPRSMQAFLRELAGSTARAA
ncbi:NmrA family NAD(P)-binding protein [Cupriavidus sp. JZ107]